jgi:Ion channel
MRSRGRCCNAESAPGANITTASDALWYTIVTISTVGYGDYYPVTDAGRVAGAVIIVVGVGIFGTFTGYLANLFLSPRKTDGSAEAETAELAGAVSTEAAPTAGVGMDSGTHEARPVRTEATLDEVRTLLTRSEADLESIKRLLDRPAAGDARGDEGPAS